MNVIKCFPLLTLAVLAFVLSSCVVPPPRDGRYGYAAPGPYPAGGYRRTVYRDPTPDRVVFGGPAVRHTPSRVVSHSVRGPSRDVRLGDGGRSSGPSSKSKGKSSGPSKSNAGSGPGGGGGGQSKSNAGPGGGGGGGQSKSSNAGPGGQGGGNKSQGGAGGGSSKKGGGDKKKKKS